MFRPLHTWPLKLLDKLMVAVNKALPREPLVDTAKTETHRPRFSYQRHCSLVVKPITFTNGSPKSSWVPKRFRPQHTLSGQIPRDWGPTHWSSYKPKHTHFQERSWMFGAWKRSTWPLKIGKWVCTGIHETNFAALWTSSASLEYGYTQTLVGKYQLAQNV